MKTLPKPITDEMFNLTHHITDQVLEHLVDELGEFGCVIVSHDDFDSSMLIHFRREPDADHDLLEGELRIDRIMRRFEIVVKYGESVVFPAYGQWPLITEYLTKVLAT